MSLQPIRDALAAAQPPAAAAPTPPPEPTAEEAAEARRDADARAIRECAKKQGRDTAWRLARALKWSADDFEKLLAPKAKAKKPEARSAVTPADASGEEGGGAGTPPPPSDPAGEGDDPRWKRPKEPIKPLPDNFPVRPLGRTGTVFHYLDPLQQLVSLSFADHSAMGLRALFGQRIGALWEHWPKWNAGTGNQSGFQADRVAESLMHAGSKRGIFDAPGKVRGTGAWLGADGGLALHCGDAVFIQGKWSPPGEYDGFIYTAHEGSPRPADGAGSRDAVLELLDKLDSWNWRRDSDGDIGAMAWEGHAFASLLLLGWLAAATVGGALRWRPMVWLTGEAGSGKSGLFSLLVALLGDIMKVENASEASVRGALGQSTRPVLLDEVENDPKSPKNVRLVELARIAASGGTATRSSSDHKVTSFTLRSAFMFSSIIIPPMLGQDISRFIVLDMDPIEGARGLTIDAVRMAAIGRSLRRRVVDGWPRLEATLALWRAALATLGHDARGADTYGYIFAFVDLALWDEAADADTMAALCGLVSREAIEQKTSGSDGSVAMLQFVASTAIDAFRGGTKFTIGTLVAVASVQPGADQEGAGTAASAGQILRERGVFVERDMRVPGDFPGAPPANWKQAQFRVTLPNQHEGLRLIFAPSRWRTEPGATGGWVQAMRRLPGVLPENSRKLGGRGWSVPVETFLQEEGK